MIRLILLIIFFLLSLLTLFSAPTNFLWYVSILVTEFCWIFVIAVLILLVWKFGNTRYNRVSFSLGIVSLVFFLVPIIGAYRTVPVIKKMFGSYEHTHAGSEVDSSPYNFWKMFLPGGSRLIPYRTIAYDSANALTMDFYSTAGDGYSPCIIVVHGGSWAGGDSQQLPELNSELARSGYHVASINYRLAPKYKFPAPLVDITTALAYLRYHAAALKIDTNNFVLLGRSAGGQIVLSAAYTIHDPGVKGVISYYGPADMVWGYANPTNPLVLNSRKVMADYLGGTYSEVPQQYVNSSATETATAAAVPTLLVHGGNDPLVSHLHGVRLSKKLDSLGTTHYNVYMPWATHGFDWTLHGPSGQLSTWCVKRFLEQVVSR
jgi:acetyl esterase/lipase